MSQQFMCPLQVDVHSKPYTMPKPACGFLIHMTSMCWHVNGPVTLVVIGMCAASAPEVIASSIL